MEKKIVVIGIGNPLVEEDSLGLKVIDELEKRDLPEEVELHKIHLDSLKLVEMLRKASDAVIVDVFKSRDEAGKIYTMTLDELEERIEELKPLSSHQLSVVEALKLLEDVYESERPERILFIGINVGKAGREPEALKAVEKNIPKLIECVCAEIWRIMRSKSAL